MRLETECKRTKMGLGDQSEISVSWWVESEMVRDCSRIGWGSQYLIGAYSLPTSTSDESKGVEWDLGLEIVQAIIGLPYHGLETNFGPSCKCVWDYCPVGRWCPGGSCHKMQGCFTDHSPESWCKGPHPSSHQSYKYLQPPWTAYSPKLFNILLQTSSVLLPVYYSTYLGPFLNPHLLCYEPKWLILISSDQTTFFQSSKVQCQCLIAKSNLSFLWYSVSWGLFSLTTANILQAILNCLCRDRLVDNISERFGDLDCIFSSPWAIKAKLHEWWSLKVLLGSLLRTFVLESVQRFSVTLKVNDLYIVITCTEILINI